MQAPFLQQAKGSLRTASTNLSQPVMWFQLAKVWLTTSRSHTPVTYAIYGPFGRRNGQRR